MRNKAYIAISKTILFPCIISSLLCTSCTVEKFGKIPFYSDASFNPIWTINDDLMDTLHTISPFYFVNQYGEIVTQRTFEDHVFLANFISISSPASCQKMTDNLKSIYKKYEYDEKVLLLSHSVTPKADSVPQLLRYAENNDIISGQWHFVTGNQRQIYSQAKDSYFIIETPDLSVDSTQTLCTDKLFLIDKNGHIRGVYNGNKIDEINKMNDDVEFLMEEHLFYTSVDF